ncbi:MAG: ABC transporter ATP-binding protein [Spirochaetota bacterium]
MSDADTLEVACSGVGKRYADGSNVVVALEGFSERFTTGEMVAVTGPSGSGKSTLLALLAAIDYADEGTIYVGDTELGTLSTVEQAAFRGERISYLFPEYNLLPMLSIYENLSLALSLKPLSEVEIDARIKASLRELGLSDLAHRRPGELSSGQRASAAIARAIAAGNPVLIADEPTAHLDAENAAHVARLLGDVARDGRHLVILATHDPVVADRADRVVRLRTAQPET